MSQEILYTSEVKKWILNYSYAVICCTFQLNCVFKDPFAEPNAGAPPPAYSDTLSGDNASRYDTEMIGFLSDC